MFASVVVVVVVLLVGLCDAERRRRRRRRQRKRKRRHRRLLLWAMRRGQGSFCGRYFLFLLLLRRRRLFLVLVHVPTLYPLRPGALNRPRHVGEQPPAFPLHRLVCFLAFEHVLLEALEVNSRSGKLGRKLFETGNDCIQDSTNSPCLSGIVGRLATVSREEYAKDLLVVPEVVDDLGLYINTIPKDTVGLLGSCDFVPERLMILLEVLFYLAHELHTILFVLDNVKGRLDHAAPQAADLGGALPCLRVPRRVPLRGATMPTEGTFDQLAVVDTILTQTTRALAPEMDRGVTVVQHHDRTNGTFLGG